jgi:DNA ligase-1
MTSKTEYHQNEHSIFTLPMLFKKTNTGAIQFWELGVNPLPNGQAEIITIFGQVGTDSPQRTVDLIKEGKNAGKKNATTALEQALKEGTAKRDKQLKKGYVYSKEDAEAGQVDEIIEGGIVPMLAHKFSEHGHKIKYPAFIQPKLDGIRMIAVIKDGKATLWSRTRKQINSLPHIVAALEAHFKDTRFLILDGEAYNHDYKDNFEQIVSAVRKDAPEEGYE